MYIHDACEQAYKRGYEDGKRDTEKGTKMRTTIDILPWVRFVYEDGKFIGWYNPRLWRVLK